MTAFAEFLLTMIAVFLGFIMYGVSEIAAKLGRVNDALAALNAKGRRE